MLELAASTAGREVARGAEQPAGADASGEGGGSAAPNHAGVAMRDDVLIATEANRAGWSDSLRPSERTAALEVQSGGASGPGGVRSC